MNKHLSPAPGIRTMIFDIAKFELTRVFRSPGNWLILALCQFLLALIFYNLLSKYLSQPALFEGRGITDAVIAGYYRSTGLFFILMTPFFTMRMVGEEIKTGAFKLLLSAPISAIQILVGKYFAALGFMACLLFIVSLVPFSLSIGTGLDYGHILTCIAGNLALIFCLVSIGLFFSSIFTQQYLAAIAAFTIIMLLWTAHSGAGPDATTIDLIFHSLSMSNHFTRFTEGVLSSMSITYFSLVTLAFLVAGMWKIHSMRSIDW
ncbi:MAG: ABC transporter permease subunit [Gammaproteobacteria bacterium]|nr:ABC transporter permease subunit [Gammaproteobacteria bacterium]